MKSFDKGNKKGLPLGNVTSQLFANVYLNELDQFAKHVLKAKYYFRYCDDFVIVSPDKTNLENLIPKIQNFLTEKLDLQLHPNKVEIRKVSQGVDFLGYVVLSGAIVVRNSTKKRVHRKMKKAQNELENGVITQAKFDGMVASYLGIVSHARDRKTTKYLKGFLA